MTRKEAYTWKLNVHDDGKKSIGEIAAVRPAYGHGFGSYGWHDANFKFILFTDLRFRDEAQKERLRDSFMDAANVLIRKLNEVESMPVLEHHEWSKE